MRSAPRAERDSPNCAARHHRRPSHGLLGRGRPDHAFDEGHGVINGVAPGFERGCQWRPDKSAPMTPDIRRSSVPELGCHAKGLADPLPGSPVFNHLFDTAYATDELDLELDATGPPREPTPSRTLPFRGNVPWQMQEQSDQAGVWPAGKLHGDCRTKCLGIREPCVRGTS